MAERTAQAQTELDDEDVTIYKMSADHNNGTTADYDYIILERQNVDNTSIEQYQYEIRMTYLISYCVILILGVTLNFIVIVIISCRKFKSFQAVAIWIMALAVTHLVSCTSVVFQLLYAYNDFKWNYGFASCKLSSYITYGSMFFTATMLSLWSIQPILAKLLCMCKKESNNCSIILISLSFTIAAVLACPSLFSREVRYLQCIDDYDFDDFRTTQDGITRLKAVVVMRFLLGLVVPALVMFLSCCVTSSHRICKLCRKQAQIICALKIAYFVCWGPQIVLTMLQATVSNSLDRNMSEYGLPAATVLATTHLFTCPLIYMLLGRSFKMNWIEHDPDHNDNRS
ncbi:chemerin-like receptor 1 isoform X1 [Pseudorasbora parva]|uniref:chemerin-like receptor 1 isoform X1 n=2 Tax=Pseudorasbora parva TaxID=51549 RepID=UPI00351E462D